jgi:uncharacterized protein
VAAIRFDWDPAKARINLRKHGVSFDEAESVFYDDHALLLDDPDHSHDEDRFVLLGLSSRFWVLVVVRTYRELHEVIRIISARKATEVEQGGYDARWRP